MRDVFKVADALVRNANRKYPDDVALIVYYGSYATGTASETSDLDMYYIIDDGKDVSLYTSVLVEGLTFEFWPVSWGFAEKIASGRHSWSVAPSLIANAEVLYARSQKDLERFNGLKQQIENLKKSENKSMMFGIAMETMKTLSFYADNIREAAEARDVMSARAAGWDLISNAIDCLALLNQTYFIRAWGSDISQIDKLERKPERTKELIEKIMLSNDTVIIKEAAEEFVRSIKALVKEEQKSFIRSYSFYDVFDGYYPGIKEYVTKVQSACAKQNAVSVSAAATKIQREVSVQLALAEKKLVYNDTNLYLEYRNVYDDLGLPDISKYIEAENYSAIENQIRLFDKKLRELITNREVSLNEIGSLDEFQKYLESTTGDHK